MTQTEDYRFCNPYLGPGEAILWRGKPEKGHLFTTNDIFMIPFSLLWCGFAVFWEVTAFTSGAPIFFCIWGVPFVCVGLYMVFGRFLWTAFIRKRTAYVVTNKQIIRKRWKKIDILNGKNMPVMHVSANQDGTGTIRFGQDTHYYRGFSNRYTYPAERPFSLENIPNVANVQRIISNIER